MPKSSTPAHPPQESSVAAMCPVDSAYLGMHLQVVSREQGRCRVQKIPSWPEKKVWPPSYALTQATVPHPRLLTLLPISSLWLLRMQIRVRGLGDALTLGCFQQLGKE